MKTDTKTITVERRIDGSPEDVFAYFTDPEKHVRWQGTKAELDPRPGGAYIVEMTPISRVRGRYVEVDFPKRILLEWGVDAEPGHPKIPAFVYAIPPLSTIVEITFTPDGDGTIVRVVQSGLAHDDAAGFTTFGWTGYLDRLTRLAAGADPGPDPFAQARELGG
jgi:uncharacterized protein YndB with AHSA1/START domain